MLARFQQAGGTVEWHQYDDSACDATFAHPKGSNVRIKWDLQTAKQAGLGGKQMWSKYPRRMLWARVVSEGVRTCFPARVLGVYTPEEIQDFEPTPLARPAQAEAVVLEPEPTADSLSPEAVEGVLQSIEACSTEDALQIIVKQLKSVTLSKATHTRLAGAYRAKLEQFKTVLASAALIAAVKSALPQGQQGAIAQRREKLAEAFAKSRAAAREAAAVAWDASPISTARLAEIGRAHV